MNKSELETLITRVDQKFSGLFGIFNMLSQRKSTDLECALWWYLYAYKAKAYIFSAVLKLAFCTRFRIANLETETLKSLLYRNNKFAKVTKTFLAANLLVTRTEKETVEKLGLVPLKEIGLANIYDISDVLKIKDDDYLLLVSPEHDYSLIAEQQTQVCAVAPIDHGIARLLTNNAFGYCVNNQIMHLKNIFLISEIDKQKLIKIVQNVINCNEYQFYRTPLEDLRYNSSYKYKNIRTLLCMFYPSEKVDLLMSLHEDRFPSADALVAALEPDTKYPDSGAYLPEIN